MPRYRDINEVLEEHTKQAIDYEIKLKYSKWGDIITAIEEMPEPPKREEPPKKRRNWKRQEKECVICGEPFQAARSNECYCSKRCSLLWHQGVEYNGEIMFPLEKFAIVYLKNNRNIEKVIEEMNYKTYGMCVKMLNMAKKKGLI